MPAVEAVSSNRQQLVAWRAPLAGVLLIAAGASLWGIDGVLRKPLTTEWSAWTIVLYEHAILTCAVAPILWRHRDQVRRLSPAGWLSAIVIAWGGSALATLLFTEAFAASFSNPDVVILLQKTQPLFAIGAAVVVLGERPRPELAYLLVPAVIGTYLLSFGWLAPGTAFTGAQARPALYALGAAALWGAATAFGRRGLREVEPNVLMGLRFSLALPFLAVIASFEHATLPAHHASSADWSRLFMLALGSGLIAMMLYYRGLRTTPAPVATIAELAFPATALVVNYIWLGATINGWQMLGFVILWATIAMIYRVPVSVPRGREVAAPPLPSRA
jgi:drug/metabolite transporter (DMT)-like permease